MQDKPISRVQISRTRNVPNPNMYVNMLAGEYAPWAYDEEKAPLFRGNWRQGAFGLDETVPLDLEIGTGNGTHFAHRAKKHSDRCLVGMELKYKPLIQSIRRAVRNGSTNARIARYDAVATPELFAAGELNDVYIHFPDPWEKKRQWKHRLIQSDFLRCTPCKNQDRSLILKPIRRVILIGPWSIFPRARIESLA
jgi:tRNA (guanine-N7-)-methyltransferase